jgi:hypothetical protein
MLKLLFCSLLCCLSATMFAQTVTKQVTAGRSTSLDTLLAQPDAVTLADSTEPAIDTVNIKFSKESVDDIVDYNAKDSMIYDIPNQRVYLYGEATVKQKSLLIKAAFILVDNKTNTVAAEGVPDGKGGLRGRVDFKDSEQAFTADRMKYNFKTKRGKIFNTRTKQGEKDFVQSEESKFVTKDPAAGRLTDEIYGKNALLTTCDAEEPHFGILSTKQKVIPGKLVVVGPSVLVIGGVPTPLVLPFGFFPITKGQRSGLLLPEYDVSLSLGFGLKGLGWYIPINDNIDVELRGDIYTRGTWRAYSNARYTKRYKYNGAFMLRYGNLQTGEPNTSEFRADRDFQLTWTHAQSPAAHPSQHFNASVNLGTASVLRNQYNDGASVLNNTLNSTVSYSKSLRGGMNLSASFTHSQNTKDRSMTLALPNLNFAVPTIFPFKRKVSTGAERWYEKINFNYNSAFLTNLQTYDTTLFKGDWARLRNQVSSGMTHSLPVSATFNVLRYFKVTPSVSYNENWYFTGVHKTLDTTYHAGKSDSLVRIANVVQYGFKSARQFSSSVSVNTQLFGMLNFGNKGTLRAIRHVVTPNLSFTYSPENLNLQDFDSLRTSTYSRFRAYRSRYNYYERSPIGVISQGRQNTLGLSVSSTLEAKVARRGADSTVTLEKVSLLNAFGLSTNYNLAADTCKMSPISISASTLLFKLINVQANTNFDPYHYNVKGRTRYFEYAKGGNLATFRTFNISASTYFSSAQLNDLFTKGKLPTQTAPDPKVKKTADKSFINSANVSYNFNLSGGKTTMGRDTTIVGYHDISLGASLNLTNSWRFDIGRIGYDLNLKRITYPDFSIYRDLHCWEMGMSWQPERQTYTFFLRAKPGSLDFLNVPYNKNRFDAGSVF